MRPELLRLRFLPVEWPAAVARISAAGLAAVLLTGYPVDTASSTAAAAPFSGEPVRRPVIAPPVERRREQGAPATPSWTAPPPAAVFSQDLVIAEADDTDLSPAGAGSVRPAVSEVLHRGALAQREAGERPSEAARLRNAAQEIRTRAVRLRADVVPAELRQGSGPRASTSRPTAWRAAPRSEPTEIERHRGSLHEAYAATGDPAARAELAASYDGFARSLALRYRHREPVDDLHQVARLALLHAIDRFDPTLGRPFPLFARMTMLGELKRHLRDKTWAVRVPRSLQEDYLHVMQAADELTTRQSDSPSMAQLAEHCRLSVERVVDAMDVRLSRQIVSLDLPTAGRETDGVGIDVGRPDIGFDQLENRELLRNLLSRLPDRDRRILEMRFMEEMTQTEIAAEMGVSQMCVSRVLARTLGKLRLWTRAPVD